MRKTAMNFNSLHQLGVTVLSTQMIWAVWIEQDTDVEFKADQKHNCSSLLSIT
jgi:hypothetical protein